MRLSSFVSGVIETYNSITEKLTRVYLSLKIQLPGEAASPFSMVCVGFILIIVALVINVIIRYITIQRMIEDPYLNLGVYILLTQAVAFGLVTGMVILFKGIDYAVKR